MRILIAHSFYRMPGGEDRCVRQQEKLLGEHHVCKLLERRNEDLLGGLVTARQMAYSPRQRKLVSDSIDRFRPDVIHLHNAYPAFGPAVHLAAKDSGVPLVMTLHNFRLRCPNGYMFTEGAPCRRCEGGAYANAVTHHCLSSQTQAVSYAIDLWIHRFLLKLEKLVDLFIAPSRFVRDRALEWGLDQEKVRVLRHFTDFVAAPSGLGAYGICVGRLSAEKGLETLVRALSHAGDPPFKIVGEGPVGSELQALAARLGLERLEFLGHVPPEQVFELMRKARFAAVPSVWDEVAGLAASEAMMLGRPLLVTNKGGLPELIENGEGLLCRSLDVTDTAEKIQRLMSDDKLCVDSGTRAAVRAAEEFTPAAHLEGLENAYSYALSRR